MQGCERWYAERRQPCIFRLTPLAVPDLDPYLADAGYTLVDRTTVLSLPIGVQEDTAAPSRFRPVELDEWLGTYARLSAKGSPPSALRDILMRVVPPKVFATVIPDDTEDPVACGMAVLDGMLIGVFDLVASPRRRRQGYGTALLRGLLAWGARRGAEHAYLQVVRTNLPAWTLYAGLGFRPVYDYWYRVAGRGSAG